MATHPALRVIVGALVYQCVCIYGVIADHKVSDKITKSEQHYKNLLTTKLGPKETL